MLKPSGGAGSASSSTTSSAVSDFSSWAKRAYDAGSAMAAEQKREQMIAKLQQQMTDTMGAIETRCNSYTDTMTAVVKKGQEEIMSKII